MALFTLRWNLAQQKLYFSNCYFAPNCTVKRSITIVIALDQEVGKLLSLENFENSLATLYREVTAEYCMDKCPTEPFVSLFQKIPLYSVYVNVSNVQILKPCYPPVRLQEMSTCTLFKKLVYLAKPRYINPSCSLSSHNTDNR